MSLSYKNLSAKIPKYMSVHLGIKKSILEVQEEQVAPK